MNEELARFKKYYFNLNYRQNTLPINLDGNKYQSGERCTYFIRSELICKPYENIACMFLMWTIFEMEMDSDIKKN